MNLNTLFEEAVSKKASDIHLATGERPYIRIDGKLHKTEHAVLNVSEFTALLEPALSDEHWAKIKSGLPVERTLSHDRHNFCLIVFRASDNGFAGTFRILASDVPDLSKIGEGAEPLIDRILQAKRGLFIIAGPTASGKGTSMISILDQINTSRPERIFTVEGGGRGFTIQSKMSLVSQLYVGQDFDTYERALESAHNADPDVIATDDIPTAEALRQVILLAETGHLVMANLHADSVTDVLRKVFDAAGREAVPLRRALAENLIAISTQRLFQRANGPGRVPAYEWLYVTPGVRSAILHGDMERIINLQGSDPESKTLQSALTELVSTGKITEEAANQYR